MITLTTFNSNYFCAQVLFISIFLYLPLVIHFLSEFVCSRLPLKACSSSSHWSWCSWVYPDLEDFGLKVREIWNSQIVWCLRLITLLIILWVNLLSTILTSCFYFWDGYCLWGAQTAFVVIMSTVIALIHMVCCISTPPLEETSWTIIIAPIYLRWKSMVYADNILAKMQEGKGPSKVGAFYDLQQYIATVEALPQLLLQSAVLTNMYLTNQLPTSVMSPLIWSLCIQCGSSIILLITHGTVFEIQTLRTHFDMEQTPIWTMFLCFMKMSVKYVVTLGLFGLTFGLFLYETERTWVSHIVCYLVVVILCGCQYHETKNHLPKFLMEPGQLSSRVKSKNIARICFQLTIEASSTLMILHEANLQEQDKDTHSSNTKRNNVAQILFLCSTLTVIHMILRFNFRWNVLRRRTDFFRFKYPRYAIEDKRLESFPYKKFNDPSFSEERHTKICSFRSTSMDSSSSPHTWSIEKARTYQALLTKPLSEQPNVTPVNVATLEDSEHAVSTADTVKPIINGHFFSCRWTDKDCSKSTCCECGTIVRPDTFNRDNQLKDPSEDDIEKIEKDMKWAIIPEKEFQDFALSFCIQITEDQMTRKLTMKCPECNQEENYAITDRKQRSCGYCDYSIRLDLNSTSGKDLSKIDCRMSCSKSPVFRHKRDCPFRPLVQERLANHCNHYLPSTRGLYSFHGLKVYDVLIALSRCYVMSMLGLSFYWAGPLVNPPTWTWFFIHIRIPFLFLMSNLVLLLDYALDQKKSFCLLLLCQILFARGITVLKSVPDVLNSLYMMYFGILSLLLMYQTRGICESNEMILSIVLVFSVAFNILPIISFMKTECEKLKSTY